MYFNLQEIEDKAKHGDVPKSFLNSSEFTILTKETMCKIKDVHSWRFYFACGKRMILVGLGVSTVTEVLICVDNESLLSYYQDTQ